MLSLLIGSYGLTRVRAMEFNSAPLSHVAIAIHAMECISAPLSRIAILPSYPRLRSWAGIQHIDDRHRVRDDDQNNQDRDPDSPSIENLRCWASCFVHFSNREFLYSLRCTKHHDDADDEYDDADEQDDATDRHDSLIRKPRQCRRMIIIRRICCAARCTEQSDDMHRT